MPRDQKQSINQGEAAGSTSNLIQLHTAVITSTTDEEDLLSVVIPGGGLGLSPVGGNVSARLGGQLQGDNTAATLTLRVRYGAVLLMERIITTSDFGAAGNFSYRWAFEFANLLNTSFQTGQSALLVRETVTPLVGFTIVDALGGAADSQVDQTLRITSQASTLAVATSATYGDVQLLRAS